MLTSFIAGEANTDLNGHGTHIAGTIGSKTYGVAKKATLYGVKVLNGQGSGSWSGVIAGINYVVKNAVPGKTIINMSLGGSKSQALNDAVDAAYAAGVVVIVAAGNDAGDAALVSPAGASGAFAVGATDNTDTLASFSNRGKAVRLFAPGVNITSLWKGANGATNTISGTSMASPRVAGITALFMANKQYTSAAAVYADLINLSTPNVIKRVDVNTPNRLAYDGQ